MSTNPQARFMIISKSRRRSPRARSRLLRNVAYTAAALGAVATINRAISILAERRNPPKGKFITVDSVKLHYLDRGDGPVLVLLHGNGSMVEDFIASGLLDGASKQYRVIAFDRPGFGYSSRPRNTIWTPAAQANLIHKALAQLGVSKYSAFGHSWGASVAIALGSTHGDSVENLFLASGYYYPVPLPSMFMLTGPSVLIFGDVLAYTIAPIVSRMLWPELIAKIFRPVAMPPKFNSFPKAMALRPSQLRASAIETAFCCQVQSTRLVNIAR